MKKHYKKMSMTPLGIDFESSLMVLQGSVADNATVKSMGQDVENYGFDMGSEAEPFYHQEWD